MVNGHCAFHPHLRQFEGTGDGGVFDFLQRFSSTRGLDQLFNNTRSILEKNPERL